MLPELGIGLNELPRPGKGSLQQPRIIAKVGKAELHTSVLTDRVVLSAQEIAGKALKIASDICVYTNSNIIVETV